MNPTDLRIGAQLKATVETYIALMTKPGTIPDLAERLSASVDTIRHHITEMKRKRFIRIEAWTDTGKAVYGLGNAKDVKRPKIYHHRKNFNQEAALERVQQRLRAANPTESRMMATLDKLEATKHGHKVVEGNVTRHVMR